MSLNYENEEQEHISFMVSHQFNDYYEVSNLGSNDKPPYDEL